jgi:hypothetical protein
MRRNYRFVVLLLVVSLATIACASAGAKQARPSTRNVITADQIKRIGATNALEAVQRLQPRMLEKQRGPSSINFEDQAQIVVYLDNSRLGGIETLTMVQTGNVVEIRYLSASEATTRFGTGNAAGAIVITTKI